MRLRCVSRYSSHHGSFEPGQIISVSDEVGGEILRSSRESFVEVSDEPAAVPPVAEPVPDTSAMSEATETGIVAPDRRARGGRKRKR